ncbi:MAG: glycosyltransferase [Prevotellaceae bacterium]|nr:glycosyltransferase [Prevotellaceae bacterium]
MYYYIFVFRRVGLKTGKYASSHADEPVSVIVCVKNEDENLSKFLPLISEQNYPEYEIIVVNDNSTDNTDEVLKSAQARYPHLQVRNLVSNSHVHGQSVVLGVGIKAAKYDRLAVTDVNCRPSANWLHSLSFGFDRDIVTAYTRCTAVGMSGRIANYFDALFELGYALNGKPYTAAGGNTAFRKELFFNKGFNPLLRKPEKVERVFFNSVMNGNNTAVVLLPDAIVESEKTVSFGDRCRECSGELFTRRLFRKGTRHLRLPEIVSRALFYPACIAAAVLSADVIWMWTSVAGIFLTRLTVQIFVFNSTQKALGEKKMVFATLVRDFYFIFVYLYIFLLIKHRKAIKYQ